MSCTEYLGLCPSPGFDKYEGIGIPSLVLASPSLAGSSTQWGAWNTVGMAHSLKSVLGRVESSGLGSVSPNHGLAALQAVLYGSMHAERTQARHAHAGPCTC